MRIGLLSTSAELYSTQTLIQAAVKRGHEVDIINYRECSMVLQEGFAEAYFKDLALSRLDGIIPRIGTSFTSMGAALLNHCEMMELPSTLNADALILVRDKLRSLQKLQAAGLPIPKTIFIGHEQDVKTQIKYLGGLPVVIKLIGRTHGIGVVLAESASAAVSTVEAFQALNEKVIIQEFIAEARGADLRAFVVNGEVVASMKRQAAEGEFRSNLHRGATAQTETLSPEETELACRAAQICGLEVAGVDILRSKRGPLVLEINASPGLEGIENATGIDVAGKVIEYLVHKFHLHQFGLPLPRFENEHSSLVLAHK
jgi:ribosomal protein S6--L-glutamate ligase